MVTHRLLSCALLSYACGCQAFSPIILRPNNRAALQPPGASPCSAAPTSRHALNIIDLPILATKFLTATTNGGLSSDTTLKGRSLDVAAGLLTLSLLFSHPVRALADSIPGMAPGCSSTTNVSGYTMVTCDRQGLDRDGRLLGCSSSENCLSTSAVRIPAKLGSPWEYAPQTHDADRAFASLVRTVEDTAGATMKTIDTKTHYLLAQFPSKVPPGGVDFVEFLVKSEDQIVLYRSVSRDTLYVYPLQQPVSDQGQIKERLEGIRKELGWGMYTYEGQ